MKRPSEIDLLSAKQADFIYWADLLPGDRYYDPGCRTFALFDSVYEYQFVDTVNSFDPGEHVCQNYKCTAPNVFLKTFGLISDSQLPSGLRRPLHCNACGEGEGEESRIVFPSVTVLGYGIDIPRYAYHIQCLAGRLHRIPCYWHPAYDLFERCQGLLVVTHKSSRYRVLLSPKLGLTMHVTNGQNRPDHLVRVRSIRLSDVWEAARSVWPEYVPEFPFGVGGKR